MLNTRLEAAQARIRERWYPGFAWVVNDSAPWAPLTKPLSEVTVALVSTCGLYRSDVHVPFAAWNDLGDPSFRVIHDDTPPERLRITHAHYDHHHVAADHEVSLPVIHFHQLVKEWRDREVLSVAVQFYGLPARAAPVDHRDCAGGSPSPASRRRRCGVSDSLLTHLPTVRGTDRSGLGGAGDCHRVCGDES